MNRYRSQRQLLSPQARKVPKQPHTTSKPKVINDQPLFHKSNRPTTLINKMQLSLANYIKSNKTKIILSGTKLRFFRRLIRDAFYR